MKSRRSVLTTFVLFASFASVVAAHAPLIGYKTYANVDEGYAAALASRLLDGHKLYQGAISQRGPLMYYTFEAIGAAFGWDNIVAVRLVALALALAHVFLVYWMGRKLVSKPAALVATLVTAYALSFGFPPEDGMAVNGESLQLPALLVGVTVGATAMRHASLSRARLVRLFVAGVAFGVAVAIKQSIVLHPAVLVLWLVIDAHRRQARWTAPLLEVCVVGAGVLLVPLAFVVYAATQGTLADLYYYTVTYNRTVHMRPATRHFEWLPWVFFRMTGETTFILVTTLLFGLAIPRAAARARAAWVTRSAWALARGFGPRRYLMLHLVVAFVSASAMWRFFPHYYLQCFPFFALCVGAVLEPWFRFRPAAANATVWAFGAFTMIFAGVACDFSERVDGRVSHDETVTTMGKVIMATTNREDRIFVWGFSSWLYGYAHRRPAGRYMFETYVTGFVPWYWQK
ncbi:MAG TPA: glycosyltransferase family 39 protein, partial [Polyangiaceae bacterium]|nr:glycosyltransferase family 39 protein [Polyangiaceae bacterium]